MAIYTDFFVAGEDELLAAFPLRFPVTKRPKVLAKRAVEESKGLFLWVNV